MKTKTAYRPKNIPAEQPSNIPEIKIEDEPVQPSASVKINFDTTDKAEPNEAVIEAIEKAAKADEASEALKRQLAHLHASEELQRQRAAQMAQPRPMSREEKLAAWRSMPEADEGDIAFLEANPAMIDRHDVTVIAAEEAAQMGHERGTEGHRLATKAIFDRHLGHQQAQPAAPVEPSFFAPEPQRSPAAVHEQRASIVSAPVSRGTASYETGQRPTRQIKLTPQDQEYARIAGISDVEYAKQKQRLALHKANGDYTGRE